MYFELLIDRCDTELPHCNSDEQAYTNFLGSFYINIMDKDPLPNFNKNSNKNIIADLVFSQLLVLDKMRV
jgi:hypothetical protein